MKLYDVFFFGSSFDRNRFLPQPADHIAYAHNTNGEGEYLIPYCACWVEVDRLTALSRGQNLPSAILAAGPL
jgi:hypothetical protein